MKNLILTLLLAASAQAAPVFTGDMLAPGFTVPAITSVTFLGGTNVGVSTQTTFLSSITVQNNLAIGSGFGLAANGVGTSTMASSGWTFFISSHQISGSTCTAGTAITAMSTFTVNGRDLKVGDTLVVECGFMNDGVAPTGAIESISSTTITNVINGSPQGQANELNIVRATIQITQANSSLYYFEAFSVTSGGGGGVGNLSGGVDPGETGWSGSGTTTFFCTASRSGGGNVNFSYMKVSKR